MWRMCLWRKIEIGLSVLGVVPDREGTEFWVSYTGVVTDINLFNPGVDVFGNTAFE